MATLGVERHEKQGPNAHFLGEGGGRARVFDFFDIQRLLALPSRDCTLEHLMLQSSEQSVLTPLFLSKAV